MDLEPVSTELYALPRDEFTAARNAAAKRAREQGHRELAERIGALRRPSTAAWLVNQLVREHPDEVRALVELGDGLREAQRTLQGEQLRRLSRQRHELVQTLVHQAQALARTAGHPVGDAVTHELGNTFTAAVNSAAAAQALTSGRLTSALDPADAAAELFSGAGADAVPRNPPDLDSGTPSGIDQDEELHRDLERARSEATDADTTRDAAKHALADADQASRDAAAAVQELRARLEAAEGIEHEARRRAQSAQRDFEAADRAARESQRRVQDLERRLAPRRSR
ncbi:MAG: hypothetical protein ACRDS0_00635 [Pseudonocardiaceae bacterium]